MANINKYDKWEDARNIINDWLKLPEKYCNNCGFPYIKGMEACCNSPQIGDNLQHTYSLINQIKNIKATLLTQTAATSGGTMRWGVSLPPRLYHYLNKYFQAKLGEKLFADKKNDKGIKQMRQFAKKFPQFTIPERI